MMDSKLPIIQNYHFNFKVRQSYPFQVIVSNAAVMLPSTSATSLMQRFLYPYFIIL